MMPGEFGSWQVTLVAVVGMVGLVFYSLSLSRRARQRAAEMNTRMQEQFSALRGQPQLHGSMDELLTELEDYSRQCNAQLDMKFAKLEAVVRDADARIARLESLLAECGGTQGEQGARASAGGGEGGPDALGQEDARVGRIHALADEGLRPMEIAEAVGVPLGEVEVVLNLRRFGRGSAPSDG